MQSSNIEYDTIPSSQKGMYNDDCHFAPQTKFGRGLENVPQSLTSFFHQCNWQSGQAPDTEGDVPSHSSSQLPESPESPEPPQAKRSKATRQLNFSRDKSVAQEGAARKTEPILHPNIVFVNDVKAREDSEWYHYQKPKAHGCGTMHSLRGSLFFATGVIENFTCFDSKFNRNDRTMFISSVELADAMNFICERSFEVLQSAYNKITRYDYSNAGNYIKLADCCKVYNANGVDVTYEFDLQSNCKAKFLI